MTDYIVIAIIICILFFPIKYVVKARKNGVHCIGCSSSKTCSKHCHLSSHSDANTSCSEQCNSCCTHSSKHH